VTFSDAVAAARAAKSRGDRTAYDIARAAAEPAALVTAAEIIRDAVASGSAEWRAVARAKPAALAAEILSTDFPLFSEPSGPIRFDDY
jgi:hypothetical protein